MFSFPSAFNWRGASTGTTSCDSAMIYQPGQGYDPRGLASLIELMRAYDSLRSILETRGGHVTRVQEVTRMLTVKVEVSGPYGNQKVSLSQPDALRHALTAVGQTDVKFTVRRLEHGFPAYYLARIHHDWWGIYSLIVEDLHFSHGYPLLDRRFARLMTMGRERYYLRLSLFRDAAAKLFKENGNKPAGQTDALLYALGRCIFQGAWHTDQRFAFAFAEAFHLPRLRNAIELVYLSLSCDLSALRRFLTPGMFAFFESCYANPAIEKLLNRLDAMTGAEMSNINVRGLEAYQRLSGALNEAVAVEIPWASSWHGPMPLWKIVVANINRLDLVRNQVGGEPELKAVVSMLDETAGACIEEVLEERV